MLKNCKIGREGHHLSKRISEIIQFVITNYPALTEQKNSATQSIIYYWQLREIVYEHSARGGASLGPPITLQSAWRVEKHMNNKIFVWENKEF